MFLKKPDPEASERDKRKRRRWGLAPIPSGVPPTEIEGLRVLEEVRGSLGTILFQRYRDVDLWSRSPGELRDQLFCGDPLGDQADGVPSELRDPLSVLGALINGPGAVPPRMGASPSAREIATACSHISSWATDLGHDETAAAFAILASQAEPFDPDLAVLAGRGTRRLRRFPQAEQWYRRAVGLARRADNDTAKAAAYLGWAVLEEQRGNHTRARYLYMKALRVARTGRLRELAAAAHHYLMPLTLPDGTLDDGMRHAVAAYKLYQTGDPGLARLASDTGAYLSEHGLFSSALILYRAALAYLTRPADRVAGLANIARAAAAVGDFALFSQMLGQFEQQTLDAATSEFYPASALEIAQGAYTAGLVRTAKQLSEEAVRKASTWEDRNLVEAASRFRAKVEEGGPGDTDRAPPPDIGRFVRRFAKRLSE